MEALKVDTVALAPGITKLSIHGGVDPSRIGVLKGAIDDLFRQGIYKIVMDLKGAEYISSTGIGCFITSVDVASDHGGQIVFIAAPPQIQKIAEILMLSDVFAFVQDEKAALDLLSKKKS